jgi:hypothetical protein
VSVIYRDLLVYLTVLLSLISAAHIVSSKRPVLAPVSAAACSTTAPAALPSRRAQPRFPEDFV